jgi:hypothetical protein
VPPLATRDALYAIPAVPAGNVDVLIVRSDAGETTTVRVAVSTSPRASFTCTVNVKVPAADGVPAIAPAGVIANPDANCPADSDHAYGASPLDAASGAL